MNGLSGSLKELFHVWTLMRSCHSDKRYIKVNLGWEQEPSFKIMFLLMITMLTFRWKKKHCYCQAFIIIHCKYHGFMQITKNYWWISIRFVSLHLILHIQDMVCQKLWVSTSWESFIRWRWVLMVILLILLSVQHVMLPLAVLMIAMTPITLFFTLVRVIIFK